MSFNLPGKKDPLPSTRDRSPPDSAYTSKTVTIQVGTGVNKQTFYVHRDLISFYSGYFKAALNGGFAEAKTGVIELKSEEPPVFECFINWLYTQKARKDKITRSNANEYLLLIVKLWIFADRRDIPLLMNEMVDCLQQGVVAAWVFPKSTITEIYNNTTEGSGLRRMVVYTHASLAGAKQAAKMEYDSDIYVHNFVIDLIKSLIGDGVRKPVLSKEQYGKAEMCPSFHIHEEGVKCTKKSTKRSKAEVED